MNEENMSDKKVIDLAKQTLEISTGEEAQSDVVKARLQQARREALNALSTQTGKSSWTFRPYLWGGSLASVLLGFVLFFEVYQFDHASDHNAQQSTSLAQSELEWLIESDELEMLEQDLEFYYWLEAES